jgi:hypothetical protein
MISVLDAMAIKKKNLRRIITASELLMQIHLLQDIFSFTIFIYIRQIKLKKINKIQ